MDTSALIASILESRRNNANLTDLAQGFLAEFKGVDGVMREVKLVYDGSEVASDKIKILTAGIDLVKQVASTTKGVDPLEGLEDDELKAVLNAAIRDLQGR